LCASMGWSGSRLDFLDGRLSGDGPLVPSLQSVKAGDLISIPYSDQRLLRARTK
jgi:hypothetical protein